MSARAAAATIAGLFVVLGAGAWWARQAGGSRSIEPASDGARRLSDATFVGASECAGCHANEAAQWQASMHARAMQRPSATSVAAPFSGETFSLHGVTSTFSRRDGKFIARTDGSDGASEEFDVAFTFGVYPLQQYLLAQPGGRLQALGVAWDARPAPQGQRWFHLYPATPLHAGDAQHWTSRSQTWNFMCAECHSTNLQKRYVESEDRYDTTWTDVSVACEACHGPGSRHVAWARGGHQGTQTGGDDHGLTPLSDRTGASWVFDPGAAIAHRDRPRTSRVEIEMCARCHSRRAQFAENDRMDSPLAASHRPALLETSLYFADGQIKDEVFEYGSFLQSRMYAAGVTCSDCHDPHKPEIGGAADAVCQRCHRSSTFATPAHHHHQQGSAGSSCVSCHMPSRTYMTVDERRDHSFRVPRPDLTTKIGTPNACNQCHADRSAAWASERVKQWYGTGRSSQPHYGEALAAGRAAAADAAPRLLAVVDDAAMPGIVRATAVSLLGPWVDQRSMPALQRATRDPDALVRMAAVEVLSELPQANRVAVLTPLLADSVRTVRQQSARALALAPQETLGPEDRERLKRGLAEWDAAQHFNGDTAAGRVNVGTFYAERGESDRARQEYEAALRLEPYFAPAAVNLADLYRSLEQDEAGERVLRQAISRLPDAGELHRSLGLLLARRRDMSGALSELRRAAELGPDDVDAQYTLAVALYSTGQQAAAIERLEHAWSAHPGNRVLLSTLIAYVRERGELSRAAALAERLVALTPTDPSAQALLNDLRRAR